MTILAFVLGGVYGVFKTTHDSIERVDRRTALTQIGRVLVSDLSRELASIYPLEIDLSEQVGQAGPLGGPGASVGERMVTFVGEDEVASDGRDVDTLRFTAAVNDPRRRAEAGEIGPAYDLAEVLYYIDDDETTPERGLVRQSNDLPGLASEEVGPEVQEISANVVGMNVRYLDDSGDVPEWVDRWEDLERLPAALELMLYLTPDPERRDMATVLEQGRIVTALIRLPIRQPIVPVGAATEGPRGGGSNLPGGRGGP
jgi:hypothetical protein